MSLSRRDDEHPRSRGLAVHYARFSLVGASNAAVDIGALNLLLRLFPAGGLAHLVLCNAAALALANANSYLWNTLWTFRGGARHGPRRAALFAGQALLNLGAATGLFWLAAGLLGRTALPAVVVSSAAKAASMAGASTLSFFALRHLAFAESGPTRSRPRGREQGVDPRPPRSPRAKAVSPRRPPRTACGRAPVSERDGCP